MKYSRQREVVLNAVMQLAHPTAEEVFVAAKKTDSKIGIATVYRNLNLLAATGAIMRIEVPNRMDRFDCDTGEHYHAVCEKCGKVFDLAPPKESYYNKMLKRKFGFIPKSRILIIYGICKECAAES